MGSCSKLRTQHPTGEQIVGDPSIRLLIGVDGGAVLVAVLIERWPMRGEICIGLGKATDSGPS